MQDIMGLCSICGSPGAMYTCVLCGRLTCRRCIDTSSNVCGICINKRKNNSDTGDNLYKR
ncbi:MAG: orotate phosphoribosyltransferase [Candidatus Thermoplasmatota archaeon]